MDCLVSFVMGGCGFDKRKSSPEILTVNQIYIFVKVSSVERRRQMGQESPLL